MNDSTETLMAEAIRLGSQRKLGREYARVVDMELPIEGENIGVYPWQAEFHNAGAHYPERCLLAANQTGKSRSGAAETAIHLTGEYPNWWEGRRFTHPVQWWTGAERTEDSKDIIQSALLGQQGDHGTGWIPKTHVVKVTYRQAGVPEVVDKIYVQHKSGGISEVTLKTYQMEAKAWRGKTLHGVWLDEECKQDIYSEAQTRVFKNKGIILKTVTPILGVSEVVRHFLEAKLGSGIYMKNVSWEDAPHLDETERKRLAESYPEHERDARTKGAPMLGSGAVYPIKDEAISVDPFKIPDHYYKINGIDHGIDHPGAGAFLAWDKDADTIYVYDCYKQKGETPIYHAAAMKKHGDRIPNAWPHDGLIRDKGSGIALKDQYRKHGLRMLREHAHYPDERGNHREPGTIEIYEWMRTGRFKVFSNLSQWFEEKRLYHRKDGQIVAKYDDILSATRYAFMMRRFARHTPILKTSKPTTKRPILGGATWNHAS